MKRFKKEGPFGKKEGPFGKKEGSFGKKYGGDKRRRNFGGDDFGRGGGFDNKFEKRGYGRPQGRGSEMQLFEAVCANCGQRCEVPFRPTGSKPVYCRDCFRQNEESGGFDRHENRGGRGRPRERFEPRGQESSVDFAAELANINRKLDQIIESLALDDEDDEDDDEADEDDIDEDNVDEDEDDADEADADEDKDDADEDEDEKDKGTKA